jgi:uncharacterized peroxidase-related enzyme
MPGTACSKQFKEIPMSRIPVLEPARAQRNVKDLLAAVNKSLGLTPNVFRVAAQSSAALAGLIGLNSALAGGGLGAKTRESIALVVAQANACDYCLSAHTALGRAAGLSDADIAQARDGKAADPKAAAAVRFARSVVETRGGVSDADLASVRQAGFGDGDIVEIVANVVSNIFTNYINRVAATDIDFPVVNAREAA